MRRAAVLLALAASAQAHAQLGCQKTEYVEAKDWPVEQVEAEYCRDIRAMYEATSSARAAGTPAILRAANTCAEQAALYERVLKNLHHRPPPKCQ